MDRRELLAAAGLAGALIPVAARAASSGPVEPDATIRLWPGEAPGLQNITLADHVLTRSQDTSFPDRALDHVRTPRLDVFRAREPNGAALLVMPGGGYSRVVLDKEGYEIGRWLAARGVTVFVLLYRLPGDGWTDRANAALADAQHAMRLIRSQAAKWQVDPARIAAMGFSAGGHLCADLATRHAAQLLPRRDAVDALDARPMLVAPIYPVITMDPAFTHMGSRTQLIGKDADAATTAAHSAEKNVSAATPPCFLVHAEDDPAVPAANTLAFRAACKTAGVPVEAHLFEKGGHGFGLRGTKDMPVAIWPELFHAWARSRGLYG